MAQKQTFLKSTQTFCASKYLIDMFNRKNYIKKRENNQVYTKSSTVVLSKYLHISKKTKSCYMYQYGMYNRRPFKRLLVLGFCDWLKKNLSNFTLLCSFGFGKNWNYAFFTVPVVVCHYRTYYGRTDGRFSYQVETSLCGGHNLPPRN